MLISREAARQAMMEGLESAGSIEYGRVKTPDGHETVRGIVADSLALALTFLMTNDSEQMQSTYEWLMDLAD